ncbi:uncharacterized protein LOC118465993 isoform X2 [Anopheles albimanus]|nr:uncharacterized protein LOC118465993 isoform X2 [Anopheles albimanus]
METLSKQILQSVLYPCKSIQATRENFRRTDGAGSFSFPTQLKSQKFADNRPAGPSTEVKNMALSKWIYVAFKGEALDSDELMYVFRPFGNPTVGKIVGKHHAYVKFENAECAAKAAATMNRCVIDRKGTIEVSVARPPKVQNTIQKLCGRQGDSTSQLSVVPEKTPRIPKVTPINPNVPQAYFEPITEDMVRETHPFELKDILASRVRPIVAFMCPEMAEKLTGMIVELDNAVVLKLLKDMNALKVKVEQAAIVLCDFLDRKRASVA